MIRTFFHGFQAIVKLNNIIPLYKFVQPLFQTFLNQCPAPVSQAQHIWNKSHWHFHMEWHELSVFFLNSIVGEMFDF